MRFRSAATLAAWVGAMSMSFRQLVAIVLPACSAQLAGVWAALMLVLPGLGPQGISERRQHAKL